MRPAEAFVATKDGGDLDRVCVRGQVHLHHLCAVLTILFVSTAWQTEAADGEAIQDLLHWIRGLKDAGLDIVDTEITEEDLESVLAGEVMVWIDYARVPSRLDVDLGLPADGMNALVGLLSFLHGAKQRAFTDDDVAAVCALMNYTINSPVQLRPDDSHTVGLLRRLFTTAADELAMVRIA